MIWISAVTAVVVLAFAASHAAWGESEGDRAGGVSFLALLIGLLGLATGVHLSGDELRDAEGRYCAAELAPLADTVEYLRENRECVDVVMDGGEG